MTQPRTQSHAIFTSFLLHTSPDKRLLVGTLEIRSLSESRHLTTSSLLNTELLHEAHVSDAVYTQCVLNTRLMQFSVISRTIINSLTPCFPGRAQFEVVPGTYYMDTLMSLRGRSLRSYPGPISGTFLCSVSLTHVY